MKFTSATIDLENSVITMFEQFGEVVHFDMNEYRNGLPKYAGEQFEKMKFTNQIGSILFYS